MKIKEIHLRYGEKEFEIMRKKKDNKQMTWEDFIYFAIVNL